MSLFIRRVLTAVGPAGTTPVRAHALTRTRTRTRRSITTIKSKGKFSCTCLSITGEQERKVYNFHDLHHMGLHARDLFALNLFDESVARDYNKPLKHMNNRVPFIFSPRENSIIVSLGNVKSIVYKDYILIFNPTKPVVRAWTDNLANILPKFKQEYPTTPFELVVVEMILQELTEMFDRRLRIYSPLVGNLLSNVGSEVDAVEGIQKMVPLQDGIQAFEIEVRESRQRLLDLLAENEDMMDLLLTHNEETEVVIEVEGGNVEVPFNLSARTKSRNLSPRKRDRVAAELLLEGYVARLSHALNEIIYMQQKMQSRANMATMVMTMQRNRIMRMNLHTSIAAVSIGTASCVAGVFGMNLTHGYEETEGLFLMAVGSMGLAVMTIHGAMTMKMFGWGGDTRKIQDEAERVEIMKGLLNDLGSIDHAIKIAFNSIDGRERDNIALFGESSASHLFDDAVDDARISKTEFRNLLLHSRGFEVGDVVNGKKGSTNNVAGHDPVPKRVLTEELSRTVDSEVETFFNLLDTDNNGFLDLTEFVKKQNRN